MERLTSWCEEIEEAFLSCEKCKKNGMTECWSQENCTQTVVDRLAEIEDILGNEYDLDRLKQLLDACKGLEPNEVEESKFLIATQKDHEKMARLRELSLAYSLIGEQVYEPNNRGFISTYKVIGFYASECSILVKWILLDGVSTNSNGFEISALGEKVFVIREAAESALKAMKEREKSETD